MNNRSTSEILNQLEASVSSNSEGPRTVATSGSAAAAVAASSAAAMAVADQMIHRAAAAMADVHAHAMSRVAGMREQLDELEKTIVETRTRAEEHMGKFIQLVSDGDESIRSMERAIARIEDHLIDNS